MDKLTDVFHSGAIHDEDQPSHLVVVDPEICVTRCTEEFGNPCQHFCPAAVYEWPHADAGAAREAGGVVINADAGATVQAMITVMDTARQLGFVNLTFPTQLVKEETDE